MKLEVPNELLLFSFFYGSRIYFRARCIRSFIYPHPFSISSGRPFPLGVLLLHCCYLNSQLALGRPAVPYVGVLQHITCRLFSSVSVSHDSSSRGRLRYGTTRMRRGH